MIKCVIFDLGDTIWNSSGARKRDSMDCFDLVWLRKNGFNVSKKALKEAKRKTQSELSGLGWSINHKRGAFSKALLKNLGINATMKMASEAEDCYHLEFNRYLKLMPNAIKILSWLKKNKFIVFVLSNANTKDQTNRIKEKNIEKYFNKIFLSEALGCEKSSIVPFHIVLKWLKPKGIRAKECLMVGNDPQEDMFAKHAGIRTVLLEVNVPKPKHKTVEPDYRIKNLIELKKIIRGIGSQ